MPSIIFDDIFYRFIITFYHAADFRPISFKSEFLLFSISVSTNAHSLTINSLFLPSLNFQIPHIKKHMHLLDLCTALDFEQFNSYPVKNIHFSSYCIREKESTGKCDLRKLRHHEDLAIEFMMIWQEREPANFIMYSEISHALNHKTINVK